MMHYFTIKVFNATVITFLKGRHLGIHIKRFGALNSFEYMFCCMFFDFSLSLLPSGKGWGRGGGTTGEGQSVITRKQSREISGRPQQ
jgi:hypothetical protein